MTYLPPANGGRVNLTIGGNTAGAGSLVSTGTATLVGGNNITLSQNGNAITISGGAGGAAGSNTIGMSNLGNSVGTSGVISGSALRFAFAGGNNVTLSQSINASSGTITISAASQTAQTQSNIQAFYDGANSISTGTVRFSNSNGIGFGINGQTLTASHNGITSQTNQTLGMFATGNSTQNSSTVLDARSLTFNGLGGVSVGFSNGSVQISGATGGGGGGGGIALANSQTTYTSGTANLSVAGGAMTIASSTAVGSQSFNFSVPQTSSLAATGIVSISTNGGTISIGAANPGVTGSYFDNMFQANASSTQGQGVSFTSVSTGMFGRLLIQPLAPGNELFPFQLTASTMRLGFSNNHSSSASASISAAHSSSWYMGVYTRVNSTQLSLLNSVSTSYSLAANLSNSASYLGARWLSFHSSLWSSQPVFQEGSRYFFALMARTGGATYASHSLAGMHLGASVQRSGYMAVPASSNTSFNAWHPFMGIYSATTLTAMPASIGNADINKASVYANFIPQVILDAGLGAMD